MEVEEDTSLERFVWWSMILIAGVLLAAGLFLGGGS